MTREKIPSKLGFCMPAEWEEHDSTWLAWPYDQNSFPNIEAVERSYVAIIKALAESERVDLLVKNIETRERIIALIGAPLSNLYFHEVDYADVWIRDYGPIFLLDSSKGKVMVDFKYNAYGNKFPELLKDDAVPGFIKSLYGIHSFRSGIVLEGGSIEVNGKGTLLTTEQCLLNSNRNPSLSREDIEKYLKDYLGVKKIIWLKEGIINDHTDGHIDDVAKFVSPNTILCAYEEDENDPNHSLLKKNYEALIKETDQDGKYFKIIKVPMPKQFDGSEQMPVSYINFYIGNTVVLVPTFNHGNDEEALKIIRSVFTDRKVVGIDCTDFIYGGGTIHCGTQQEPKAV